MEECVIFDYLEYLPDPQVIHKDDINLIISKIRQIKENPKKYEIDISGGTFLSFVLVGFIILKNQNALDIKYSPGMI